MSELKEIVNRIKNVEDMRKITNAMYLIASNKVRKAKAELDKTLPYFNALNVEIKRIFRSDFELESKYYYPITGEHDLDGSYGYLVITADKGLAGAYNQNVIKETVKAIAQHPDPKLFVVGEYGRHHLSERKIAIEESFNYTAQNPSLYRAREIGNILLKKYKQGELKKIYVVYTEVNSKMQCEVKISRLLPFHRDKFNDQEKDVTVPFEFIPSKENLLDNIVPSYVAGFIYSALVYSFCSEQNSRLTAMDTATRNAQDLLADLRLQYNHVRQSSITQEINEISAGSKYRKETQNND